MPNDCAAWLYSFKQENIHISGTSSVFSEDLYKPPGFAQFFYVGLTGPSFGTGVGLSISSDGPMGQLFQVFLRGVHE